MRLAADFRSIARDVLKGKWTIAVLVGLVASLLGAVGDVGPDIKFNIDASNANVSFQFAGQTIFSTGGGLNSNIGTFLVGSFMYIMIAVLIVGVVYFILGSVVAVGYARFNLNLVDCVEGSFENLFAYFTYWKTTAAAQILQGIYILLWTFLLVIPGIIAFFNYAMTEYILAEHPELSASEAISKSKEMMKGNKWRLCCLEFSFIGWNILCAFTLGIGNLWLTPYKQAAIAAFYREVSGTEHSTYENEWNDDADQTEGMQ